MRAVFALVLSLILAFASQAEAVARSEMAGATDQVICGGAGDGHVTLDASGHVVHMRACLHCVAAGLVADMPQPALTPAAPLAHSTHMAPGPEDHGPASRTVLPAVRGPPVLVV